MKTMPATATAYKRTATFTRDTVPDGLRKAHKTARGVWGRIVVLEGALHYEILEPYERQVLTPELPGVVEPAVPHRVAPLGEVRFFVAFYRCAPAAAGDASAR